MEWSPTENGPKVINLNCIKIRTDFSNKKTLNNIITNINSNFKNQSNSLSVTINNDDVLISSIKINLLENNQKIIYWYESKVMGESFCDNYYNYYFPMESNNDCLLISLPKKIKDNILNSSKELGFNLVYLSVGIFSAAALAKQLYKEETKKEYLIWKICKNNHHLLVYYNNDKIKSFIKFKSNVKKIIPEVSIGSEEDLGKIKSIICNILLKNNINNKIENIFIYQTKENNDLIKKILKSNPNNINVLDFSKLIESNNKDTLKYISYAENGICFKGLDL